MAPLLLPLFARHERRGRWSPLQKVRSEFEVTYVELYLHGFQQVDVVLLTTESAQMGRVPFGMPHAFYHPH